MFRATLAHITKVCRSGFQSQLKNIRINEVADANKLQSKNVSRVISTKGSAQSEKLKGLKRPKPTTIFCNNGRYPNRCTCSSICANIPGTTSRFSTCQSICHRMVGASEGWKISSINTDIRRPCVSSSTARLRTECISDTDNIQHVVQPKSSVTVEDSQLQQLGQGPAPTSAPISEAAKFWSHRMYKAPDGKDLMVHYCRTLESAETVAKLFLDDTLLGLDMEWKANASALDSIQNNVSLIQLANAKRIALFHIAMFKPAKGVEDLVPPTLKAILENPDITKTGVSIKADCTRLRKYLGINARAIFELSHLYKLIMYCQSNPELINKKLVNLSTQVEEHFGLPLAKDVEVRCSDWTIPLNYSQVQYAASDPYACIRLFNVMNKKRKALNPMPPLPAHAELNLPIRIVHETPVNTQPEDVEVIKPTENPEAKEGSQPNPLS
ncbi:ribonuclease H-like domain-containing protein [Aspergillus coremiiformis]|uniref:Ribonuclease H-like domain-containing protein n=1 Tax=Aspergillus coremiiformis TaxID=138285 RepID=A0A5N6YW69_9EURO|nr:ribonuclease H-like domain-containing protein [Aspergillus coremiiformis]